MSIDLTLKSTAITNREAVPPVLNTAGAGAAGILREVMSSLQTVTASLTTTSIIRMVEVPSNAVISQVMLYNAAQASGAVDVGVYRVNKDGGAVVNSTLFATAVDISAAIDGTDITNESTSNTIAKRTQPLWQAAGLATDPGGTLDIALTVATSVTTGTGAIALKVRYID